MKKKIYITIIFLLLCIAKFAKADDLNNAYKSLEKGDYKTAIYFLSYFANLGNARAQYNYAIMLKKGLGTKKDPNEAFKWLFISAEQGNTLANYALGNMYYFGEGITKNYTLSFQSYLKASLSGHPASKINLGNLYFHGHGVKKNLPKAYLWWKIALDQNINGADENIKMLEEKFSKNEKKKAYSLYYKCLKITLLECSKLN